MQDEIRQSVSLMIMKFSEFQYIINKNFILKYFIYWIQVSVALSFPGINYETVVTIFSYNVWICVNIIYKYQSDRPI